MSTPITFDHNHGGQSSAGGPAALNPLDATKGDAFTSRDVAAFEVPSGRDETWRFTPLRRLRGLHDGSAAATGALSYAVEVPGAGASLVAVESVPRADPRLGSVGLPADRVAAQAFSSFPSATVVTIAPEAQLVDPITIAVRGPGVGEVAYGHLQIRAEHHAKATVVLDFTGGGTVADNVEILTADGADLRVISVFDWEATAVHVTAHHLRLGRDARLSHLAVQLGGELLRLAGKVDFDAPGGDVELLGLYFADAGQHLQQRLLVDHSVPKCTSNVVYKGALQGRAGAPDAHTVWVGDVLIRAAAEGTRTFELNRNLVLTEGARADSVPNLEIETGEIAGAGHASATGRFDDEQLFYLRSRGIPETEARKLVVRGFFAEIIGHIEVPALRERLTAAVEAELAMTGA